MTKRELTPVKVPINDVRFAQERHKGVVLTNGQIVDLIRHKDPSDLDVMMLWMGYEIYRSEAPVARFREVMAEEVDLMYPEEQEEILRNSFRFIIRDFQERYEVHDGGYGPPAAVHHGFVHTRNIGEFLLRVLRLTGRNLNRAKDFIEEIPLRGDYSRDALGVLLPSFYYPIAEDTLNYSLEQLKIRRAGEEYRKKDPRIEYMAFWMDMRFGRLTPDSSNIKALMFDHFPYLSGFMKAAVMGTIVKLLTSGRFSDELTLFAYAFMEDNRAFYQTMIERHPDSPFARSISEAKGILGDIEIEPNKLVVIWETTPMLRKYVSVGGLRKLQDKTDEPELIERVERLIRMKIREE